VVGCRDTHRHHPETGYENGHSGLVHWTFQNFLDTLIALKCNAIEDVYNEPAMDSHSSVIELVKPELPSSSCFPAFAKQHCCQKGLMKRSQLPLSIESGNEEVCSGIALYFL
jgi:hypothetical protein